MSRKRMDLIFMNVKMLTSPVNLIVQNYKNLPLLFLVI